MLNSWKFTDFFLLLFSLVILMVSITKVAKASLDKALADNAEVEDILISPTLPIVAEPPMDLHKPLTIQIDPSEHHQT